MLAEHLYIYSNWSTTFNHSIISSELSSIILTSLIFYSLFVYSVCSCVLWTSGWLTNKQLDGDNIGYAPVSGQMLDQRQLHLNGGLPPRRGYRESMMSLDGTGMCKYLLSSSFRFLFSCLVWYLFVYPLILNYNIHFLSFILISHSALFDLFISYLLFQSLTLTLTLTHVSHTHTHTHSHV